LLIEVLLLETPAFGYEKLIPEKASSMLINLC